LDDITHILAAYIYIQRYVCWRYELDDLDDFDGLIHPFVVQEVARLDPASLSKAKRMGGLSSSWCVETGYGVSVFGAVIV
jgi:hypothetical protein